MMQTVRARRRRLFWNLAGQLESTAAATTKMGQRRQGVAESSTGLYLESEHERTVMIDCQFCNCSDGGSETVKGTEEKKMGLIN
ncbi:hypothetical protein M0R45_006271 [Rubus argutus]|uniref:Uncharacterized protein n=1 Tax=Rubus argutus TaxID=59490 RepID=A0AAW1YQH0_RUBAR